MNAFHIMDMGDPVWLHDTGDLVSLLGPDLCLHRNFGFHQYEISFYNCAPFLRKTDCVL